MPRPRSTSRFSFALIPLLLLTWGCAKTEEPVEVETVDSRVENASLQIAFASTPDGVSVSQNSDGVFELSRGQEDPGQVAVEISPESVGGVNLVAAVNDHKTRILGLPGGDYKGQLELGSQLGTAYLSRGRYDDTAAGAQTEELAVIAIHPVSNRTLALVYRYPAGDAENTNTRREQLFTVLAEVEGLYNTGPTEG